MTPHGIRPWCSMESGRPPRAVGICIADALREFVDELSPVADQSSVFADLMDAALGEVDWHEIADSILTLPT